MTQCSATDSLFTESASELFAESGVLVSQGSDLGVGGREALAKGLVGGPLGLRGWCWRGAVSELGCGLEEVGLLVEPAA